MLSKERPKNALSPLVTGSLAKAPGAWFSLGTLSSGAHLASHSPFRGAEALPHRQAGPITPCRAAQARAALPAVAPLPGIVARHPPSQGADKVSRIKCIKVIYTRHVNISVYSLSLAALLNLIDQLAFSSPNTDFEGRSLPTWMPEPSEWLDGLRKWKHFTAPMNQRKSPQSHLFGRSKPLRPCTTSRPRAPTSMFQPFSHALRASCLQEWTQSPP